MNSKMYPTVIPISTVLFKELDGILKLIFLFRTSIGYAKRIDARKVAPKKNITDTEIFGKASDQPSP
jgi:hypothetical protein